MCTSPANLINARASEKLSGARMMGAKIGRTVPGRCHFTLNDPTKNRTDAVEF